MHLDLVEFNFDPIDINDIWENYDFNRKKNIIFDKSTFDSKEEAEKEWKNLIKKYELAEEEMSKNCKYIYYKNYLYPAVYDIERKIFIGIGLIEGTLFTKQEILFYTNDNFII